MGTYKSELQTLRRLKVVDTETGKVWIQDNHAHSWCNLCLFIMKRHKDFQLIWCDIECIAKGHNWNWDNQKETEDCWYMLDECGRYEIMPKEFLVEEVDETIK